MTTLLQKNKAIVLFNRERKKEGKRERIARGRKKLGKGRREQVVDNRHLYYYGLTIAPSADVTEEGCRGGRGRHVQLSFPTYFVTYS